jgi:hypothetical protein
MNVQRFVSVSCGIALAAGLVAIAAPASASTSASRASCAANYTCLYVVNNYSGTTYSMVAYPGVANLPYSIDDLASSIRNFTVQEMCYYEHINYVGNYTYLQAWTSKVVSASMNDKISSVEICQ